MARQRRPSAAQKTARIEDCILRANQRTVRALSTSLAQDPAILTMGTKVTVVLRKSKGAGHATVDRFEFPAVDRERVEHLATQLRPFQLVKEAIYYPRVADALRPFATTEEQRLWVEQLPDLWEEAGKDRMFSYAFREGSGYVLPREGVGDSFVADRVLYSQVVHADDASDILDHIEPEWQDWALAGCVGNWAAVAAHQQHVAHLIRPDLVPELTAWAGNSATIFHRLGLKFQQHPQA